MAKVQITGGRVSKKVVGTNHNMVCTVCDRCLGTLVESTEKSKIFDKLTKYQCICLCGGDSFTVRSNNECYFVPTANLIIKEMPVEINPNFIYNKIVLGKE